MSIRCTRTSGQWSASRLACPFAVILLGTLGAATATAEWVSGQLDLMGTSVSVELWHDDGDVGQGLVERVLDEYRRVDDRMSTYKEQSEISVINSGADRGAMSVSDELFGLIGRSLDLSVRSDGAFDITYESVGYLYDFRARQRPSEAEIDQRLSVVDYTLVRLDPARQTIEFSEPGVRINLGGIAKGYVVERGAEILRDAGVRNALLNAGGDTRVLGDRRGQPWIVGIRHPRVSAEVVTRLPVVDEAISTSGDYERFFEEDGRRYHHIINPATGTPTEGILSVTVIGPDATMTDGLSTTLFVLGAEAGLEFMETFPEYEAIIVQATGELSFSSGLVPPEG